MGRPDFCKNAAFIPRYQLPPAIGLFPGFPGFPGFPALNFFILDIPAPSGTIALGFYLQGAPMENQPPNTGPELCPKFLRCDAPLCPLLPPDQLDAALWAPCESVCRVGRATLPSTPRWLSIQRRLALKRRRSKRSLFFSVKMLLRIGAVTAKTEGLSTDALAVNWPRREEEWCAARKPARTISAEQLAVMRRRLADWRNSRNLQKRKNHVPEHDPPAASAE